MSSSRIEALRQAFLDRDPPGFRSLEQQYLYAEGWMRCASVAPMFKRKAMARAHMLRGTTPRIDAHELIVGKPDYSVPLTEEQRAFLETAQGLMPVRHGQDAHLAIDFEKLLKLGTSGLRAEIEARLAALSPVEAPKDIPKEQFYECCLIELQAVEDYAARYAMYARELAAAETDAKRRKELETIAAALSQVPEHPARSFREALQSAHFYNMIIGSEGLYQQGRPDRYLLPYYERDRAAGVLTDEEAQELIDCFCLLTNEYTPKSLAVGLMVGGRDASGAAVVNPLTYMFVQSCDDVRLAYPGVGLCVTPDTPDDLLRLACLSLSHGNSHPALFNDEVIVNGLRHYGVPFEHAVDYIHSTCVEITPVKRSSVWVASPYYNLVQPLLEILGLDAPANDDLIVYPLEPCAPPESFEALFDLWKEKMRRNIRRQVHHQNMLQMERSLTHANPLVSCLVDDCLEKGADLDWGGAHYTFIESSFVGIANLADSLYAIKKLVYEDRLLTLDALAKALKANYEGQEPLRQLILNRVEKYGNDDPAVDGLVGEISEWITDELARYRTWEGASYIPSMFCWIMHERLGRETPATPDGRLAGFPLGDGSGPAQGREHSGPTASILSSTSWCHERFIGGIAVNLKFAPGLFKGETLDKMLTLVHTYMRRGGFELQINVVDRAQLLDAQAHPELHRDLVVRIGGYSDYFTNLSPQMQQEVLLRTEHEMA